MSELTLAADAAAARALGQVVALTRWVGAGRKLTQTGRLTMAEARELGMHGPRRPTGGSVCSSRR